MFSHFNFKTGVWLCTIKIKSVKKKILKCIGSKVAVSSVSRLFVILLIICTEYFMFILSKISLMSEFILLILFFIFLEGFLQRDNICDYFYLHFSEKSQNFRNHNAVFPAHLCRPLVSALLIGSILMFEVINLASS